ncbi:MAG: hypothetical protein ROO76_07305 [Terriglobia bacterium]|nr:hypothetical protein [Terriglobia bacterium]
MDTLEEEILHLEPGRDLLHDCLGIGPFAEITITSDGFFLGRLRGDCGHNCFLGIPAEEAKARTRELFERLSPEYQAELIGKLRIRGIPPASIGIPESPS